MAFMEQWKEYKIGDIVEANIDQLSAKDDWEKALYLDTGNITENRIDEIQEFVCSELPSRARRKVKDGDIVFSTVRPNQRHYGYINNPPTNLLVSTGFAVLSANRDIVCPKFLYYWLCRDEIVDYLQNIAEQAVSAYPSLKASDICDLFIKLPAFEEQRRIAAILSSLDDKIEVNRRINDNLEQQAQALFRSWFVDFEPFGGTMPKDWSEKSLADIAVYMNGLAMQKYPSTSVKESLPVLKIKELGQGFCDKSSDSCSKAAIGDKYIITDGDVIFSWSGTLMVKIWTGGECGLNQHLFKVSSSTFPKWFYYLWTKHHNARFVRIAKDKAVTMGHIKRGELDKAKVLVPTEDIMARATAIFTPILDLQIQVNKQTTCLAQLRDTLLPKLMSGELSFKC